MLLSARFALARGTKITTLNRRKLLIYAVICVSPYFIPSDKKSRLDSSFCKVLSAKSVVFTERIIKKYKRLTLARTKSAPFYAACRYPQCCRLQKKENRICVQAENYQAFNKSLDLRTSLDLLVSVSLMPCGTYTPDLSPRSLQGVSHIFIQGYLILRWVSRLDAFSVYPVQTSLPSYAAWRDNWCTIGLFIPVLSY